MSNIDPDVASAFASAPPTAQPDTSHIDPEIAAAFQPSSNAASQPPNRYAKDFLTLTGKHPFELEVGAGENFLSGITGGVGSLADALTFSRPGTHDWAYRPRTEAGQAIADLAAGEASGVGKLYNKAFGTGPLASTIKEYGPEALGAVGTVLGASEAGGQLWNIARGKPTPGVTGPGMTGSPQSISAAAADGGAIPMGGPEPLGAPVEGGLPKGAQAARAQTLARVGLQNARESAIQGDAKSAAVDYQMTKYDQPAGRAAAAQFQAERDALATHTESMIGDTGGTIGMDEDTLANRGATIAQPFDRLRQWFSDRTKQLYTEADARAAAGRGSTYDPKTGATSLTNLESVDRLLDDPSFQNTLAAKNQQGLLNAVRSQLQLFRQNNPNGFMAAGAEQFRQWLNQVWSNDNKWAIGQFKDAVDNDVFSAAGEDVYAQARAIRTLRRQTLEDPRGISQLFDVDPNTPINRSTALEKIPDKLTQLPADQFANVLKTLNEMPEELQPDAQAAIGEIKAHLLNKTLQAGTQTSRGVGAQVWGADRVAQILRTNASKFRMAFADDPAAQAGIEDLSNAGQILKVDQGYPGADAQAANAMKRGLISRALGHLGGSAGAAGGAAVGGPLGAAAGGAIGESVGLSVGQRAAERSAARAWNKRVRPLQESP